MGNCDQRKRDLQNNTLMGICENLSIYSNICKQLLTEQRRTNILGGFNN